jgi:hypothetical protein
MKWQIGVNLLSDKTQLIAVWDQDYGRDKMEENK